MARNLYVLSAFFLLFFSAQLHAQDQLILINGSVQKGKILSRDEAGVRMQYQKRKKTKEFVFENRRIFSVTQGGTEEIVYKQDTTVGDYFTVEEMKHFILGEQDAEANFDAKWIRRIGFLGGFSLVTLTAQNPDESGAFDQEPGGLAPILYVIAYTAVVGSPRVKINLKNVSDPALLSHEEYVLGYERVARSKKVFGGLLGSVAGVVTGFVTYAIFR